MFYEILLAIIQSATEFLPVSSSGHLALTSNLIGEPDLFLITILHFASLFAVLVFLRKEILKLISFEKKYRNLWIYLIISTIPAAFFGFFLSDIIEKSFSSYLFLGFAFIFTGIVIFSTKYCREHSKLNWKNSLFIGFFQVLALFPGVSRSGMVVSSGLFSGLKREEAVKFSFLMFIPVTIGAMILKIGEARVSTSLILPFLLCFALSYFFINLLYIVVKNRKFWVFSIYVFVIGLINLFLYFFTAL